MPSFSDPDPRYRIEWLEQSATVGRDDVLALWAGSGVVPEAVAAERIDQVACVASVRTTGELAGVSTIFLATNELLRAPLWHYRTFIASEHRSAELARHTLYTTLDEIERRFVSGQDRRGAGMLIELENDLLKRMQNRAIWRRSRFVFAGENERGDHVRVRWFEGAHAPPP